jgi:hypothetical protein
MTVIHYGECQIYETTQIDTQYGVAVIAGHWDFLTLRARQEVLLMLQNEVFIKFSGHNTKCRSFLAPVAHNGLFLRFARTPVPIV